MKIALTGASGFLGAHVLGELAGRDDVHQIVVAGRSPVARNAMPDRATQVHLDLSEADADVFDRLGRPDALIHLAWSGLPNYKGLHHFEHQLSDQYRFLSSMIRGGLTSLLCTGTCLEYGMQSGELDESRIPDPTNPYAAAKDALRRQLSFLQAQVPFALTWCRLFYTFGPGQAKSSIYSQLEAAIQRGDHTFPMSGGEQLRDYLPVGLLARQLVALSINAPGSGIVNACSGRPISIRSLVEHWLAENGWAIQLELGHFPYVDYEPMAFWGSNRRLLSLLGHQGQHGT